MAILTIYILVCHHNTDENEIPNWLKKMSRCMEGCGGRCCRVRAVSHGEVKQDTNSNTKTDLATSKDVLPDLNKVKKECNDDLTWQGISKIMDAFFFRVFLITTFSYQLIFMMIFGIGYTTQ